MSPRGGPRTSRYAALVTAGALALYLLLATQAWVVAVVETAPGGPSVRSSAAGGSAVPWGPAAALLGLAAAALSTTLPRRWPRAVAATGAVGAAAAPLLVLRDAVAAAAGAQGGSGAVSAAATVWAWSASVVAVVAVGAALTSLVAPPAARRGWRERPGPPGAVPTPAERQRREAAEQWRTLTEGRDPTAGP